MLLSSQAAILIEIESIVNQIIKSEQERAANRPNLAAKELGLVCERLANFMGKYLSAYDSECEYSEHLEAFWAGCKAARLLDNVTGQTLGSGYNSPSAGQVGAVVLKILAIVKNEQFKRRVSDRLYQANEKNTRIREYAEALHKHYSRLLVVRVDWYYRQQRQCEVDIRAVYRHFDLMIQGVSNRTGVFENLVGYAWCVEQGISRGYHLHTVFYFPGSDHQRDWYMAKQIGELWESVTDGLGTYHNCNTLAEKEKYDSRGKLGVGMIHRNDKQACANSVNAISYLADPEKEGQYLRIKPHGRRAFAMGRLPKNAKPKPEHQLEPALIPETIHSGNFRGT